MKCIRSLHPYLILLLGSMLLPNFVWGQSENMPVADIVYSLDGNTIDEPSLLNDLRNKTEIVIGKPLSRYAIRKSIEAIYSIGNFSQIEVVQSVVPDGILVQFVLTRKIKIRQILFTGNHRLNKHNLLEIMKSRPEKEYSEQIANKDQQRIHELYKDYGYFQAEVRFTTPRPPLAREVDLLYQINEGGQALIRELGVEGGRSIQPKRLKKLLKSKAGNAYQKGWVESDIGNIQALYRKEGYLTVQVKSNFDYDEKSDTGSLIYEIIEGKKVILKLVGDNVDKDELKKKLSLFKQDCYPDNIMLRSAAQQISRIYQGKGYYDPEVTYQIEKESRDEIIIRFSIDLGVVLRIHKITFEGNKAFKDTALLGKMETQPRSRFSIIPVFSWLFSKGIFDPETLENDRRALELVYRKAGYPKARIKPPEKEIDENKQRIRLHIKIDEGPRELVQRVAIEGNSVFETDTLRPKLAAKPGAPYNKEIVAADERYLQSLYAEKGYIYASIEPNYQRETETLIYRISEGVQGRFGKFHFDGDGRVKVHVLEREFERLRLLGEAFLFRVELNFQTDLERGVISNGLRGQFENHGISPSQNLTVLVEREGRRWLIADKDNKQMYSLRKAEEKLEVFRQTIFRPDKLVEAQQRLFNLGLFREVRIERNPRPEGKSVTDVDVAVKLRRPGSVSVSGGYSPSEGIRGTFGLAYNNLYKRNMRAGLQFRLGTRGNLYELTLIEPWFKPPLIGHTIGTLRLFEDNLEERDDIRARGGTANLAKRLGSFSNLATQYKYQQLHRSDSPEEDTTVSSLGLLFHRDNRDGFLNPKSGWLNDVSIEYADKFLGGDTRFLKFKTDNRFYRQIRKAVLASALRLGWLRPSRDREILSFERFWVGGSTTVRGHDERSLGPEDGSPRNRRGDVLFIFNTELRFPIYRFIGGVLFFDTGNVWNELSEIKDDLPRSAIGAGVRVDTPLGPARLDAGFQLTEGFPRYSRIHIQLGHAF